MQRNLSVTPVHLDSSTAMKITMGGSMFQERALMGRTDVWHKIKVICGAKYDKEVVLKLILNAVEPAEMIPVKYQISGEDTCFIVRNCGPALDKLCRCNLIINNPNGDSLVVVITLGFASIHNLKVNMQALILSALAKRYDPNKRTLCLDRFHKDKDMSKIIYCPLIQLRTFSTVLKAAKLALATFEHLNLQHNELFSLSAIESSNLSSSIKSLDLRHNNLMGMETLTPLRGLAIAEIWLDGNPLCENYSSPIQYIESARQYCPHLTKLDGVYVGAPDMPLTYNCYFKNSKMSKLVDQFITHFFTLYDQNDRIVLKGLYRKDAFYSMTFGIPVAAAGKKKLNQFVLNSRNLVNLTDNAKRHQLLIQGQGKILSALKKLPRSYHDKSSFCSDLIYDSDDCLVISVEGVFKNINSASQVLSFNRTFVLVAGDDNEYNIINDQYHVDHIPLERTVEIFEDKTNKIEFQPMCFSSTEREQLITTFRNITTMNQDWSCKYLEEVNWDLRKAITNFMEKYLSSSVPTEAFYK